MQAFTLSKVFFSKKYHFLVTLNQLSWLLYWKLGYVCLSHLANICWWDSSWLKYSRNGNERKMRSKKSWKQKHNCYNTFWLNVKKNQVDELKFMIIWKLIYKNSLSSGDFSRNPSIKALSAPQGRWLLFLLPFIFNDGLTSCHAITAHWQVQQCMILKVYPVYGNINTWLNYIQQLNSPAQCKK